MIEHRQRISVDHRVRWWSWVFPLVPLASLGLATAGAFVYATARTRSRALGLATLGYVATTIGQYTLEPHGRTAWLYSVCIVTNWLVGAGHAIAIRKRVARARWSDPYQRAGDQSYPKAESVEADLAAARANPKVRRILRQRSRRRQAKALIAADPMLADELRIGRPDLDREFDDGGLIDVNHVPVETIAGLPGFNRSYAEQVDDMRARAPGLSSVDEVIVETGIPAEILEPLRDRLIFRPVE